MGGGDEAVRRGAVGGVSMEITTFIDKCKGKGDVVLIQLCNSEVLPGAPKEISKDWMISRTMI